MAQITKLECETKTNRPQIGILNIKEPRVQPCDTLNIIFNQDLNVIYFDPFFVYSVSIKLSNQGVIW